MSEGGRRFGSRSPRALALPGGRLADGTVTARAEALMARPPAEVAAAWEAERPYWKVDP